MWTQTVTQLQVQLNIMHFFDLFHEMNTKDARDADKSGQIIMGNSVHFQLQFLSISLCLLCHVGYITLYYRSHSLRWRICILG